MMIRIDDMEPKSWAAMCSPIDLVLPGDKQLKHGALYIGTWIASMDFEILDSHHIDNIVSINEEAMMVKKRTDGRGAHRIILSDSPASDIRPHLDGACKFISDRLSEGDNVLVHCHQGISRSASIVIAYLMRERNLSYDAALIFLKEKRRCVKPNDGFERTLRVWNTGVFTHAESKPKAKLMQRQLSNNY